MSVYDEIEIEDMDFEPSEGIFYYPCPCGDRFQLSMDQIKAGYSIGECPSCSLQIRVIFDETTYEQFARLMKK